MAFRALAAVACRARARAWPDARGQEGYTLSELVTVMAVMGIVLGAITTVFVSGWNAEAVQVRRLDAQQGARNALVQMRRELHCASAVTATPGVPLQSFVATVPAVCFGSTGSPASVTYRTTLVSTGRYRLERVQGASVRTLADHLTTLSPFTYTAPSASSLGRIAFAFTVDVNPSSGAEDWNVTDQVVLRNTVRA